MGWSDLGGLLSSGPSMKTFSTLSKQQQGVNRKMSDYLQQRVGQGLPTYPGPMVSPYEQQGLNTLGQYLGGSGQYMPQRQGAYAQALGGQMLSPIDMGASKEWFEQNVVPQYQNRFQQMAAPALEQAKAMGAGVSSSGMNRALAEQTGQMGQYLGDVGYQYMLQEQQAQRQREEQNAQYRLAAMGQPEPERAEQLGMIQASQQYGGLEFVREMQEFLRTAPEYNPYIQYFMQLIGGPGTSSESTGAGLGYSMMTSFAGGAGSGAGAAMGAAG